MADLILSCVKTEFENSIARFKQETAAASRPETASVNDDDKVEDISEYPDLIIRPSDDEKYVDIDMPSDLSSDEESDKISPAAVPRTETDPDDSLCFNKKPFTKLIDQIAVEVGVEIGSDITFEDKAYEPFQHKAERDILELLKNAYNATRHANRVTLLSRVFNLGRCVGGFGVRRFDEEHIGQKNNYIRRKRSGRVRLSGFW